MASLECKLYTLDFDCFFCCFLIHNIHEGRVIKQDQSSVVLANFLLLQLFCCTGWLLAPTILPYSFECETLHGEY